MEMAQSEMNLSVPAVPALVELLNCDPGPGMHLKRLWRAKKSKERSTDTSFSGAHVDVGRNIKRITRRHS